MVQINLRHPNGTDDVLVSPRKDVFSMTENVPAIPIAVVGDDTAVPAIQITLTQIVQPLNKDIRILEPTSPGTGEITSDDHLIELGYSTLEDVQGG